MREPGPGVAVMSPESCDRRTKSLSIIVTDMLSSDYSGSAGLPVFVTESDGAGAGCRGDVTGVTTRGDTDRSHSQHTQQRPVREKLS